MNTDYVYQLEKIKEAKDYYSQNGFVALASVFGPEQVIVAQRLWEQISTNREQEGKLKYRSILLPHESFPEVMQLIRNKVFLKTVRLILGGEVQLLQSQLMYGYPGTSGFSPHQDNYYNRVSPSDAVCAAWIAFQDADESNGALQVWVGSHKQGLFDVKKDWIYLLKKTPDIFKSLFKSSFPVFFESENDTGVIERFVYAQSQNRFKVLVLRVPAGTVVFINGDLMHASLPNSTQDRFRYSLLTNFIRKGSSFNKGILTGRQPIDLNDVLS